MKDSDEGLRRWFGGCLQSLVLGLEFVSFALLGGVGWHRAGDEGACGASTALRVKCINIS
jgi:hypothetical protein